MLVRILAVSIRQFYNTSCCLCSILLPHPKRFSGPLLPSLGRWLATTNPMIAGWCLGVIISPFLDGYGLDDTWCYIYTPCIDYIESTVCKYQVESTFSELDTGWYRKKMCRQHLYLMDFKAPFPGVSSNQSMKSTVPGAEWHRLRPVGFPVAPPRATQRHFGLGRARCQRGVEQNPGTWRGGTGGPVAGWDCLDGWMDGWMDGW